MAYDLGHRRLNRRCRFGGEDAHNAANGKNTNDSKKDDLLLGAWRFYVAHVVEFGRDDVSLVYVDLEVSRISRRGLPQDWFLFDDELVNVGLFVRVGFPAKHRASLVKAHTIEKKLRVRSELNRGF